mgnify:FL=1
MNTVVKWSNISRRSVLIAVMLFIILFLFWWSILPVPLFQDPYATVLFDREGQVMGMKVADDGQMRFEEVQDLPPRYVISVLVFEGNTKQQWHKTPLRRALISPLLPLPYYIRR